MHFLKIQSYSIYHHFIPFPLLICTAYDVDIVDLGGQQHMYMYISKYYMYVHRYIYAL